MCVSLTSRVFFLLHVGKIKLGSTLLSRCGILVIELTVAEKVSLQILSIIEKNSDL